MIKNHSQCNLARILLGLSYFVVVFCFNLHLFAQETNSVAIPYESIQNQLDQYVTDTQIPGVIVGVDIPGERWIGCSGIANIETQERLTPDTQFRLASITKTFTATMIMKLVEMGTLSLDDTVDQWLPGKIRNGENITLLMLLNHTSGLYDHENTKEMEKMFTDSEYVWSEEEVIQLINQYQPEFNPGTQQSYCNSGYYLLGMIAEKATNDTVDHLTHQYVFTPAEMYRSQLTKAGTLVEPSTPGYTRWGNSEEMINTGNWNLSWDWTAGSGVSTASDLISLIRALFSGKILNQDSLNRMKTPISPSESYGFGMGITRQSSFGEPFYSHAGYNPGTFTGWYYFLDSNCVITFCLNYSEYRNDYVEAFGNSWIETLNRIHELISPTPSGVSMDWVLYR